MQPECFRREAALSLTVGNLRRTAISSIERTWGKLLRHGTQTLAAPGAVDRCWPGENPNEVWKGAEHV